MLFGSRKMSQSKMSNGEKPIFQCGKCLAYAKDKINFDIHIQRKHGLDANQTEIECKEVSLKEALKCGCGFEARGTRGITMHRRNCYDDPRNEEWRKFLEDPEEEQTNKRKRSEMTQSTPPPCQSDESREDSFIYTRKTTLYRLNQIELTALQEGDDVIAINVNNGEDSLNLSEDQIGDFMALIRNFNKERTRN